MDYVEKLRAVLDSTDPEATFEHEDLDGRVRRLTSAEIARFDVEKREDHAG